MSVLEGEETQKGPILEIEDRVVDANVLLEFTCAICLHLLREPRQCTYGHNICLKCFQDLAKYPHLRSECPTCRCPMDKNLPNRNLVLENLLAKLDVYCRHHFIQVGDTGFEVDTDGCSEHQSLSEIEKHEAICEFAFVDCPHSALCGSLRRGKLEEHVSVCSYKIVPCVYCSQEMMRKEIASHEPNCPDLPITCRHCSVAVAQKRMKRHLERECEGKLHECPYAQQGCDVGELSASALATHLTSDAALHLELVQLGMNSQIKLMENKFLKMLAIKDAEIEDLKRASRNRYRFEWFVPWSHDGSTIHALTSEKFDIFGHKFYLALWPLGEPKQPVTQHDPFSINVPSLQPNSQLEPSSNPAYNAHSATSSATPAPTLAQNKKSFSTQLLDRVRGFTRPRSISHNDSTWSTNAHTGEADSTDENREPTYTAIYLMMEPQQPAPPTNSAAPRIYSPVSGLVPRQGVNSSTPHNILSTSPSFDSWHSLGHEIHRTMNVSLNGPRSDLGSSNPLPMRPPETMILEYTLRLVNNSPLLTKSAYFEMTYPIPNGNGWGEEKFIETSQITRSSGFLNRNNSLHVQCDIQVRQCTFDV